MDMTRWISSFILETSGHDWVGEPLLLRQGLGFSNWKEVWWMAGFPNFSMANASTMRIKPSILGMFNHANQTINHGIFSNHGNWTHQSWEFKFRNPANKCVCGMLACWRAGIFWGRLKNQTCILRTCGHQKYVKVNYKATQQSFTDRVTGHFWWWL